VIKTEFNATAAASHTTHMLIDVNDPPIHLQLLNITTKLQLYTIETDAVRKVHTHQFCQNI